MPLVKQLDCDCRQLEELYLDNMDGLEELSQPYANSGQWCPCLLQLRIQNSPKLSVFPSLSLSLQSMELSNVGSTALPNMCLGSESGEGTSLDSLSILYCKELMSPVVINALQHLGRLTIHGCPELVCTTTTAVATGLMLAIDKLEIDDPMLLLTESFRNLTSLRELDISNCSKLESISGQMEEWLLQRRTTLNSLTLGKASSLESLPDSLHTFSSLKKLTLHEAWNLRSLPRLPSSLERLTLQEAWQLRSVPRLPSSVEILCILGCSETLKGRCRKDEGADSPNIKHIRYVYLR